MRRYRLGSKLAFYQHKVWKWIIVILLISSLLAIATCIICDYFITGGFNWSLIVILSIVSFWIFIPFTVTKENWIRNALIVVSVICVPFLFVLSLILDKQLVFTLGGCIAFASVLSLWGIYFIFLKYERQPFLAFGYAFLLTIPLIVAVVWMSELFMKTDTIYQASVLFQLFLSALFAISCFVAAYLKKIKL